MWPKLGLRDPTVSVLSSGSQAAQPNPAASRAGVEPWFPSPGSQCGGGAGHGGEVQAGGEVPLLLSS